MKINTLSLLFSLLVITSACDKELDDFVSLEPHKNEYKTYIIKGRATVYRVCNQRGKNYRIKV